MNYQRIKRWMAEQKFTRLTFDAWLAEHHPEFSSWEVRIAGEVYPCAVADYDKVIIRADTWLELKEKIERRAHNDGEE